MNAVEKMSIGYEDSFKQFDIYRRENADTESTDAAKPINEILLPWAQNKANLYQMFGEKLIISKPVEYSRSNDEILADMGQMLDHQQNFTNAFFAHLTAELHLTDLQTWRRYAYSDDSPNEKFYYALRGAFTESSLIEARLTNAVSATICGQRMVFAEGQKSMRAIGKVARALGLEQEFEKFRVAHSMVLNQAKLKGQLCLSIHPLDFATASDNESGWSSCMSWREGGSYRLGTVEMMTSPYVICAYLASDSVQMDIGDGTWPSKKWRAWIIVDKDFIVVNRNYPYDNEDLCYACVNWVREMASEYYHITYDAAGACWNQSEPISIEMNYMYNDLGDDHIGCYATNYDGKYKSINVSGPAICMWCGNEIPYNSEDDTAYSLCCEHCGDRVRCTCCGETLSEGNMYWGPDDEPYCEYCYSEHFSHCDRCDSTVNSEDVYHLVIPVDYDWLDKWMQEHATNEYKSHTYRPEALYVTVCDDCIRDADLEPRDLDWKATVSFSHHTAWGQSNYWDGAMINPKASTWDKIADLFSFDPEDPFYIAIWQHYCECVQMSADRPKVSF